MQTTKPTPLSLFLLFFLLIGLTACATPADSANDGTLNVVATTGQLGDTVQNVGGEAINLTTMFGPGIDPHLYVPTESDVNTLSQADVIFYNGLHLEAQMTRVMEQLALRGVVVVAVGDELPADRLIQLEDDTPYDPHVWNDPLLWQLVVEQVRDTLAEADPANAELYQANAAQYLAEIEATHQYILAQIQQIPPERRVMITAHDAFAYYARAFGLEERGLQGISTESEASTADVQELVNYIVEREIPAIFVETSVPPRTIEAVQAAVRAEGFDVNIGGELYSDALGSPDSAAGTYLGMLRHNTDTLVAALAP
jgi:manganese/zinc/iron transport system substrate-binding protein